MKIRMIGTSRIRLGIVVRLHWRNVEIDLYNPGKHKAVELSRRANSKAYYLIRETFEKVNVALAFHQGGHEIKEKAFSMLTLKKHAARYVLLSAGIITPKASLESKTSSG